MNNILVHIEDKIIPQTGVFQICRECKAKNRYPFLCPSCLHNKEGKKMDKYKEAAFEYCRIKDIDPMAIEVRYCEVPQWHLIADRIKEHDIIQKSLKVVINRSWIPNTPKKSEGGDKSLLDTETVLNRTNQSERKNHDR